MEFWQFPILLLTFKKRNESEISKKSNFLSRGGQKTSKTQLKKYSDSNRRTVPSVI